MPVSHTASEAFTAAWTLSRADWYMRCTSPSMLAPYEATLCCSAVGMLLSERGVHRCCGWTHPVVAPELAAPSTHAANCEMFLTSPGPVKARHASVYSGPALAVLVRSYSQYRSNSMSLDFRYRVMHSATMAAPREASPPSKQAPTPYASPAAGGRWGTCPSASFRRFHEAGWNSM